MTSSERSDAPRPGRAARTVISRSELGQWNPGARGHDALETILTQNRMRDQRLVPVRMGRMSASPWSYYRGAAAVMAADLASRPNTGIRVQLCGDAHVLNFGFWRTPERTLAFDLRDFDETIPGPFEWDLLRLAASLVVLARDNNITPHRAEKAVRAAFAAYRSGVRMYADEPVIDVWYDQFSARDVASYVVPADGSHLDSLLERRSLKRTSRAAAAKLTEIVEGRRRIILDPPFRVRGEAADERTLLNVVGAYESSIPDHVASLLSRFELVDAVQQVVGVGSVGMRVYLTLLEEAATGDPLFLQVKQAGPSVYEEFVGASRYREHGARVVNGQRLIQSATDIFVGWTQNDDEHYYVRQFRDGKVIPSGPAIAGGLAEFASACGRVLARAHARSGSARDIADYLGKSDKAADAVMSFAVAYADQTGVDHAQLAAAVADGSVPSSPGWS